MITFLLWIVIVFVVLPYLWRRMCQPVPMVIEPPPPAVTILTPSVTIVVQINREGLK